MARVVVGPAKDRERIPGIDIGVEESQGWRFGEHQIAILEVPAHTRGAIAFVFANSCFHRRHTVRNGLRAAVRRHAGHDA